MVILSDFFHSHPHTNDGFFFLLINFAFLFFKKVPEIPDFAEM